jgi:hypothetical protein
MLSRHEAANGISANSEGHQTCVSCLCEYESVFDWIKQQQYSIAVFSNYRARSLWRRGHSDLLESIPKLNFHPIRLHE